MSQAIIQTINASNQVLTADSLINLGTTVNRYGCGLNQNGNGIEVSGSGYYKIEATITITPTAAGNVTISMQKNGVNVPGAQAVGSVTTVGNSTTIPINFIIRRPCAYCENADIITFSTQDAATINNVVVQIVKQ